MNLNAVDSNSTFRMRAIRPNQSFELINHEALRLAIEGLERRVGKNERDIQIAINAIQSLLTPTNPSIPKKRMGFSPPEPPIRNKS